MIDIRKGYIILKKDKGEKKFWITEQIFENGSNCEGLTPFEAAKCKVNYYREHCPNAEIKIVNCWIIFDPNQLIPHDSKCEE